MSEAITRLNLYLGETKARLDDAPHCNVVIGNEAADLDSMASSIMYGFFACTHTPREQAIVLPVVNIPRNDFHLRTEAVYLFHEVGIDVPALCFIDEIDLDKLHAGNRLRLTLIDHNVLAAGQAHLAATVAAVIDHHDDAGLYRNASPRTIEPVGSAATLVAKALLQGQPALLDQATAMLLLGTILLDTVNLDPSAGRVTAQDRDAASRLGAIAGADPDGLFAKLQAEKFNVAALDTDDLLRKDYKQWQTGAVAYGISAVLTSLEEWIGRDRNIIAGCEAFRRSRKLDCLLAMMAYSDPAGAFHRQLAVFAADATLRDRLLGCLETSAFGLHRFQPEPLTSSEAAVFYNRCDPALSRKKLQPLLQTLFSAAS